MIQILLFSGSHVWHELQRNHGREDVVASQRRLLLKLLVAVWLVAAFAEPSVAQQQRCTNPATDHAMREIVENWKDGYNSGNPGKVAALYASDATYLTQHFVTGIVHGRAAIEAYVKKGTDAHYRIESIQVLASDCSGDFAYAITRYESTNAGQKAFGVNLVVLQRTEGKWLIVAHESAVPDAATAIQSLEVPTSKSERGKRS